MQIWHSHEKESSKWHRADKKTLDTVLIKADVTSSTDGVIKTTTKNRGIRILQGLCLLLWHSSNSSSAFFNKGINIKIFANVYWPLWIFLVTRRSFQMPVSTKDSSPMDLVLKTAPHQTKTVSFSLQEPFNAAKWSSPILSSETALAPLLIISLR